MSRPLVITGPTGWIGRALLAEIARAGALDRVRLFGSSAREIEGPAGPLAMRALATIAPGDVDGADIVHLAFLTKEKADALGEPAFTATNRAIDGALLSALAHARPHAVFVASSGAAALAEHGGNRHPYGLAKLAQERAFLGWGAQAGVPVLAGRIFALAGPHINKVESYAIASFLTQAFDTGAIHIAATVPVYRAYLHVTDLARLIVASLDRAIGMRAPIDVCGSEIVEMGEIARAVATIAGVAADRILRPALAPEGHGAYLGDPSAMRALALRLGLPLADFTTQLRDTADFLRRSIERADRR